MLNQVSILYNDSSVLLNPISLYGRFNSLEECQPQERKMPSSSRYVQSCVTSSWERCHNDLTPVGADSGQEGRERRGAH